MRLDQVLSVLRSHREELARRRVKSLALFGSVARDEAGPESDIDVLVEFDGPVGLFHFVETKLFLEPVLGRPVDLTERSALKRQLRDRIIREAVRAA